MAAGDWDRSSLRQHVRLPTEEVQLNARNLAEATAQAKDPSHAKTREDDARGGGHRGDTEANFDVVKGECISSYRRQVKHNAGQVREALERKVLEGAGVAIEVEVSLDDPPAV